MQFLSLPEGGIHPKAVGDLYEDSLYIREHCHKLSSTDREICAMYGKEFFFKWQWMDMFFIWLQIHLVLDRADPQVTSLKGGKKDKSVKRRYKRVKSIHIWICHIVNYPQIFNSRLAFLAV